MRNFILKYVPSVCFRLLANLLQCTLFFGTAFVAPFIEPVVYDYADNLYFVGWVFRSK